MWVSYGGQIFLLAHFSLLLTNLIKYKTARWLPSTTLRHMQSFWYRVESRSPQDQTTRKFHYRVLGLVIMEIQRVRVLLNPSWLFLDEWILLT